MTSLNRVDWEDLSQAVSVLVTALLMPLTFSIAAGIAFGFITYAVMKVIAGRVSEISAGLWTIIGFALIWLWLSA